jgi:hypothetical protein
METQSFRSWWEEVRYRLEEVAKDFPSSFEQETMLRLLKDPDALELLFEPYTDLEPRLALYRALRQLFLA